QVNVTVADVDGNSVSTNKTTLAVADAPLTDTTPTTTLNAIPGTATGTVVLMTFSDGDPSAPLSDFTATVDWGGSLTGTPTTSVALVSRTSTASNWQVVGNATYASAGNFTVNVSVNDADGSSAATNKTTFDVGVTALTDTTPTTNPTAVE